MDRLAVGVRNPTKLEASKESEAESFPKRILFTFVKIFLTGISIICNARGQSAAGGLCRGMISHFNRPWLAACARESSISVRPTSCFCTNSTTSKSSAAGAKRHVQAFGVSQ